MLKVRNGLGQEKLKTPVNSGTEERATAKLKKSLVQTKKYETKKNDFYHDCFNAYTGSMLYSK